ncbi:hypothetical protein CLOM_g7569 [Closterium sp. NIES-68]|nr:hypothetical protein CLOM_g7569 [Closterium sp. NIES-68]
MAVAAVNAVQSGALTARLASAQPAATSAIGGSGSSSSASSRGSRLTLAQSAVPASGLLSARPTLTRTLAPTLPLLRDGYSSCRANKRSPTVTVTVTATIAGYGIPDYSSPSAGDAARTAGSPGAAAKPSASASPAAGAPSGGSSSGGSIGGSSSSGKGGTKKVGGDSKLVFRNPWEYQAPANYTSPQSYVSPRPYGIRLTTAPQPQPSAPITSPAPPPASASPSPSPSAFPSVSAVLSAAEGAVRERGGAFLWGWVEQGWLGGVPGSLARVWASVGAVAAAVAVSAAVRFFRCKSLPAVLPSLLAAAALALASSLLPLRPVLSSHTITAVLSYLLFASLQVFFTAQHASVLGLPAFLGALLAAPALLYTVAHADATTGATTSTAAAV